MGFLDPPPLLKAQADAIYPQDALSKLFGFHLALANRATSPCDVLFLGDSITAGNGTSGDLTNRWTNQLITALRSLYPVSNVVGGPGYLPVWTGARSVGTGGAPSTSGTVTTRYNGLSLGSYQLGTGAAISYATARVCTTFDIRARRSTTDAFTVSVDGGAATTVTAGPTGEFTYTSTSLTRSSHTITITQSAGTPEIEGVTYYDGDETSGVRGWNAGVSGSQSSDFSTAAGGSQAWLTAATGFTPSLVVISWVVNDASNVSAATFKINVQRVITNVRSTWPNVSILLVGMYQPTSRYTGTVEPWANYLTQLSAIAAADPATAFFDLNRKVPSLSTDTYSFLADTTHPANSGHSFIAQQLLRFLVSGLRDGDAFSTSQAMAVPSAYFNTPPSALPSQPTRGAVMYQRNGVVLSFGQFGTKSNQLGGTTSTAANYTCAETDRIILASGGASGITVTLPAAVNGLVVTVKKYDSGAGAVTVAGSGGQTIDDATTVSLSSQYAKATYAASGNKWYVIG